MQKTIFRRYLRNTMIIIVISFLMLGTVMLVFFSQYWRSEKKEMLEKNANLLASISGSVLSQRETFYSREFMPVFLNNFPDQMGSDLFVAGMTGEVIFSSFKNERNVLKNSVDRQFLERATQGICLEQGTLDGFYKENYMVVGVPIVAIGESGDTVCVGVAFAAASASALNDYQKEMLEIFLLASLLALMVSFCVVGFFSYNLVRPLRQMSAAVRSFGEGDFSVRVPVTSHDEIGQLAHSFNDMANSISGGESMRRSFIANVSHELKTPMTTIAGFIDGILDGTIPEKDTGRYLKIVSNEVKRLSRLVKSMLDLSRIDSGEMSINPTNFDLPNMIVTALLTFEQSIDEKNIEIRGLENTEHINVFGDQDLLHQVMYNLIENAVKFVDEGGYIAFSVSDGIDRTGIAIENSGPGITSDDLPMIFERFYKTDKSRSLDKKGMGLGLFIVRTIIRLHGGEISVSSKVNEKTRFEFYIPKRKQEPARGKENSKKRAVPSAGEKQLNVLDADMTKETDAEDSEKEKNEKDSAENTEG
jgi:Signal transduction histidine kinase